MASAAGSLAAPGQGTRDIGAECSVCEIRLLAPTRGRFLSALKLAPPAAKFGVANNPNQFNQQQAIRVVHFSNFIDGRHYMMDKNPLRYPVTCEIDGKAHRGTYWIAGKILTVATGIGGKSPQVGSTPAEALAKRLLQDIAKEGKA